MTQQNGREPFSKPSPAADAAQAETPLPQPRPSSVLVVLLGLALIYTLYFAKTLLLPIVEMQIQQGSVHIQQDGIDLVPGQHGGWALRNEPL